MTAMPRSKGGNSIYVTAQAARHSVMWRLTKPSHHIHTVQWLSTTADRECLKRTPACC